MSDSMSHHSSCSCLPPYGITIELALQIKNYGKAESLTLYVRQSDNLPFYHGVEH